MPFGVGVFVPPKAVVTIFGVVVGGRGAHFVDCGTVVPIKRRPRSYHVRSLRACCLVGSRRLGCSAAKSRAAGNSARLCTLVIPTDDPRVAGFTKIGKQNFL